MTPMNDKNNYSHGNRALSAGMFGLWVKCPRCEHIMFSRVLKDNLKVCPRCGFHIKMNARERIHMLCEPHSWREINRKLETSDPLNFCDGQYKEKIVRDQKKTHLTEAVLTGLCRIGKHRVALGVLDFDFLGGSMGSVVGEKITRLAERAIKEKIPLVLISASGGARMQESMFSLIQMAKTSAAIGKIAQARLPYISILSHPTTGGVTASFAMLGDIIIAEPEALIGFAGPRVIEQTIKQKLPDKFQTSEFLLEHGFVDVIVPRKELKNCIVQILNLLTLLPSTKTPKKGK